MIAKLPSGRYASLLAECQDCLWWDSTRSAGRAAEGHRKRTGHNVLTVHEIDAKYEGWTDEQIADAYRERERP